jgi:hypothetical protein
VKWRTDTVLALCRAMRETRDYSACPILADALQEADYPDEMTLSALRGPLAPYQAECLVASLYSTETADAVVRLQQFANRVGYTYEKVVEGVRTYAATGEQYAGDAGHNFNDPDYGAAWAAQGAFESDDPNSYDPDPALLNEFFTAYELVTGTRVDSHHRGDVPFTCPC